MPATPRHTDSPSGMRAHLPLVLAVIVAAALRATVVLGYRPAFIFPDTLHYVDAALRFIHGTWIPDDIRPSAYSFLIAPAVALHHFRWIAVGQHLLGLATAALAYAVLLRLGCRRWLATLAVLPVLFDPLQLDIEHYVLADTVFGFVALAVLAVLVWRRHPGLRRAAIVGVGVALAALTRIEGLTLLVAVVAYLLVVTRPARRLATVATFLAATALPLAGYATWFHAAYGMWGFSTHTGRFLYGRVAQFADCRGLALPSYERSLCPTEPVAARRQDFYMWGADSPQWRYHPPPGVTTQQALLDFGLRVVAHQPLAYLRVVAADYAYGFAPTRGAGPEKYPTWYHEFQRSFPDYHINPRVYLRPFGARPQVEPRLTRFLHAYGAWYVPGPLLAGALLIGVAATLGVGRARTSPARAPCLLFTASAALVLLPAAALSTFDWRYQLPQLVLIPVAGALGWTALRGPREEPTRHGESRAGLRHGLSGFTLRR